MNGKSAKKTPAQKENVKGQLFPGRGFSLFWGFRESCWMTQETYITTELCSGFQGLGGGANQQAFCNSARMALLAAAIMTPQVRKLLWSMQLLFLSGSALAKPAEAIYYSVSLFPIPFFFREAFLASLLASLLQ